MVEISFLSFVILTVYERTHPTNVLGVSVVNLQKQYLVYAPTEQLKYFYEKKPNMTETDHPDWLPYTAIYTSNADGLNERYNYSVTKPPHTYRIITMGDSFTFGQYVSTPDNWPEQLEDMLNARACPGGTTHFEVINLGQPGYDAQYDVHRYELRGKRYDPDLVLWLLHSERWNELMTEKRLEIESHMTASDKALARANGDYSPSWKEALKYVTTHYSNEDLFFRQEAIFAQFTTLYSKPLVIMTFPNSMPLFVARLKYFVNNRPESYFMDSLPDIYDKHQLLPDGHPTKEAYYDMASSLVGYIQNMHRYTCNN